MENQNKIRISKKKQWSGEVFFIYLFLIYSILISYTINLKKWEILIKYKIRNLQKTKSNNLSYYKRKIQEYKCKNIKNPKTLIK